MAKVQIKSEKLTPFGIFFYFGAKDAKYNVYLCEWFDE